MCSKLDFQNWKEVLLKEKHYGKLLNSSLFICPKWLWIFKQLLVLLSSTLMKYCCWSPTDTSVTSGLFHRTCWEEIASEQVRVFTSHQLLHLLSDCSFILVVAYTCGSPLSQWALVGAWEAPPAGTCNISVHWHIILKYFKKRFVQNFIHSMKFPHLK